jgi:hypothetical protein
MCLREVDTRIDFGCIQTEHSLAYLQSIDFNNIHVYTIGNSKISRLTLQRDYELRIDLEDFNGNKVYAKYSTFYVGDKHRNI